jgi:hypothetical protein
MKPALNQFKTEIQHFSNVSVLNLVFSALAIGFGVAYLVAVVSGQILNPAMARFPMPFGAVAMVCFGLGISWLLSTARIFEGVIIIRKDLDREGTAITDERLTCLIVQMFAHYRDNRDTIRTMILICTLGGGCFLALGILTSLEFLGIFGTVAEFSLNAYRPIPSMLVILGISIASLFSSYYFSKFSKTWDLRMNEIEQSECTLKKTLGLDKS